MQEIAFIVEEHAGGDVTVFLLFFPIMNSGTIRVVSLDRLQHVDASMGTVVNSLMQRCLGPQALLQGEAPPSEEKAGD